MSDDNATPEPVIPPPAPHTKGRAGRGIIIALLVSLLVVVGLAATVLVLVFGGEAKDKVAGPAAPTCEEVLGDYIQSLNDLDSQLSVGLNVEAYGTELRAIATEQGRVDIEALTEVEGDCLRIAGEADQAFQIYSQQLSRWGDCIQESYCYVESLNLSDKWQEAGLALANANNLIEDE